MPVETRQVYKVLRKDGSAAHTDFQYSLPKGNKPGAWMPRVRPPLEMCTHGYHVPSPDHLSYWIYDDCVVYLAEVKGKHIESHDKHAWKSIRLLKPLGTLTKGQFWYIHRQRSRTGIDIPDAVLLKRLHPLKPKAK